MSLMIVVGWLLDILSLKGASQRIFAKYASAKEPAYPVHRAIWALLESGERNRARELAKAHWERSHSPRTGRDLIHVYMLDKDYDSVFSVARELAHRNPGSPWFRLLVADSAYFFQNDPQKALELYQSADPVCQKFHWRHYSMSVVLKRLAMVYRRLGDDKNLEETLERHFREKPSNYRDKEFVELAQFRLKRGDADGAKEVLNWGFQASKYSRVLRELWESMGFGPAPPVPSRIAKIPDMTGVTKIPVRTRLLVEGDDPAQTVREFAGEDVQPGDVVAISSAVAAIMDGRMLMEGAAPISWTARFVSGLIARQHRTGDWDASAPMANSLSVQAALEEVGTLRILVAAFLGGIGKLFGKRGWFYSISGPQAGQIDDILGALPPYDYYVIMGVKDAHATADRIAQALGPEIRAAIVDANDLGIAWAVGYSKGVDPRELERMMADNPAGNAEEQTPVVIVRKSSFGRRKGLEGEDAEFNP